MEIRNDLSPQTLENQKHLQLLINNTQEALPTTFSTTQDVIRYVNKFRDPKIAKLFLAVGNYYNAAKFYKCPQYNNTLETSPFTLLIMTISIIEKMASVETNGVKNWVDFYDWVNRRDVDEEYTQVLRKGKFRDFTSFIESLKGRWNKEFANTTKVINFLRKTTTNEDKQTLICTIKYPQATPDLINQIFTSKEEIKNYVKNNPDKTTVTILPGCFKPREYWKCLSIRPDGSIKGYCCDKANCPIRADESKLDKCFKETVKSIYEFRNKFIHDLQLPPIGNSVLYEVQNKGKYTTAELTATEIKPVIEGLIKKFFDNYQLSIKTKKDKQNKLG